MSLVMNELILRQATPADYDAVLGIDEVYGGGDYLPSFYGQYMAASHVTGYLAEQAVGKEDRDPVQEAGDQLAEQAEREMGVGVNLVQRAGDQPTNPPVRRLAEKAGEMKIAEKAEDPGVKLREKVEGKQEMASTKKNYNGKNNVVAFCLAHLTDDETTFILRAARVAPSRQGQGILRKLKGFAMKKERVAHPNLEKTRLTIGYPIGAVEKIPNGFKELLRREIYCFCFKPARIEGKMQMNRGNQTMLLKNIDGDVLKELLGTPMLSCDLFPKGVAIINWIPYSISANNALLIETESAIYVSYGDKNASETARTDEIPSEDTDTVRNGPDESASTNPGTMASNVVFAESSNTIALKHFKENAKRCPQVPMCLSAVTSFTCPLGLRVGVDIYYSQGVDTAAILGHVVSHVSVTASKAARCGIDFVHFEVFVEESHLGEAIKVALLEMGLTPSIAVRNASEQNLVLLEASL